MWTDDEEQGLARKAIKGGFVRPIKRGWVRRARAGRVHGASPQLPEGLHLDPRPQIEACLGCRLPDCMPAAEACTLRLMRGGKRVL